jgi:hypothetical protein
MVASGIPASIVKIARAGIDGCTGVIVVLAKTCKGNYQKQTASNKPAQRP